jgi:hypothetical protein
VALSVEPVIRRAARRLYIRKAEDKTEGEFLAKEKELPANFMKKTRKDGWMQTRSYPH